MKLIQKIWLIFLALFLTYCARNNLIEGNSNNTEILGLKFHDVGTYSIYTHHEHIKDLSISNLTTDTKWPGSNSITFARLVPDIYKNFDDLVQSICDTGRLDGRPNPSMLFLNKTLTDMRSGKYRKTAQETITFTFLLVTSSI